ncbi:Fic family protein [Halomonas sp. BC04]|uniref:Fic family protein n=1 Tax=Halomonas sp. BC04 TaxID=1403540 RepID=UPI0005B78ABA|nr:Fic family protein [Halomonas sp. BC04]
MKTVGYAYLHERLELGVFPPARPARVRPVTRIVTLEEELAVPAERAPEDDLLSHLLFALKHEGIDLAILSEALHHLPPQALVKALDDAPNGIYLRRLAYLYEAFVGRLPMEPMIRGRAVPLFDSKYYVTGPARRNSRWRVDFNGLGTLQYCAVVRRTPEIEALLEGDVLAEARAFMATLPPGMLDRAIQWAYLSEIQSSFAIEREPPSPDKQQRFMQLLRKAHEGQPLDQGYLIELQNSTVSNPYDKAAAFRHEQNYLHNGLPGAIGVSYLPPPPELCEALMEALIAWANGLSEAGREDGVKSVPALVAGAVISSGFVFLHPFMDGNGRISRFLLHHSLCRMGELPRGNLLPISVAMKRHEADYLAALEAFSKPALEHWRVNWIDADHHDFRFVGSAALYRYWDATPAVAFTLRMAREALKEDLKAETRYLACYDRVYRAIDARFDVRGSDLSRLVMMSLNQNGRLSKNRRKQFRYQVPEAVLDAIEVEASMALEEADALVEGDRS